MSVGRKKDAPLTFPQVAERAHKYHTQKLYLAALPYYSAMLELTERPLGLFHFQVGNILEAMSTCYEHTGAKEKAISCLQRVILIKEVHNDGSSDKSKESFFIMGRLAELYMGVGHLDLAKELLTKMEETAKETFGEQSFERGRAMCSLAGCLERNDEVEAAEKKLLECIELDEYAQPSEKEKLVASSVAYFNLGMVNMTLKRSQDAVSRFNEALRRKKDAGLELDHEDIVECEKMIDQCKLLM
jgi:tetratricopeptide (TPR) repeat protein